MSTTLSKRERIIFVATVAVVGLLVLDQVVLTPLQNSYDQLAGRQRALLMQQQQDSAWLSRQKTLARLSRAMNAQMPASPAAAESQLLHAVRDAADESGVTLSLLNSRRSSGQTPLMETFLQTTASGSMRAVSQFLWRLETAKIPLHCSQLTLSTPHDGVDNLSVDMRLSTLYQPAEPANPAPGEDAP